MIAGDRGLMFSQEESEEIDEFRGGNYLPELYESRIFLGVKEMPLLG